MLENLASFDAENEPCIFKERPKQMYASWFKKRKIEKKTHIHSVEADWKRAGPLTSRNLSLLSLNLLLSFLPSSFLFLCLISSNPPITVMSGWERGRGGGRERLCVTGRIDGGGTKVGGNGRRRFIIAFYLLWVPVIHWPCADWSVKINSRDQMSRPALLSVVVLTSWGLMWGQVGMCIKMKMPVWGYSYPKDLFFAAVRDATVCNGFRLWRMTHNTSRVV